MARTHPTRGAFAICHLPVAFPRPRRARHNQRGYMLLAILLMMTFMVIAALAVAPSLATQIKRERENELIHRGTQYARAIKRYYKKFGRYPMRIEDLENTNNLRFLRKRYKDPITGSDEWKLIHFGEATTQPKGFGSSPVAGSPTTSGASAAPGSGPSLGGVGIQTPTSQGPGTPVSTMTSGGGAMGKTFGGGPIVGVASTSDKESLKELDEKTHYNEWEFVYDPRLDMQNQQGVGMPQQGVGTPAGPGMNPGGLPGMGGFGTPGPTPPTPPPANPK